MAGADLLELVEWAVTDGELRAAAAGYVRPEGMRGVREPKTDVELAVLVGCIINAACERNGLPPFLSTSVRD